MRDFKGISQGYPLFWIGFLGLAHLTMGLRVEHWVFVGLLLTGYFAHPKSRSFAINFFPFQLFGILYDLLRIIPKQWAGAIHIQEPYLMETTLLKWLGIGTLPTDFFHNHHHVVMDIVAGLAYSLHVVIPVGLGLYLWIRKSPLLQAYTWGFLALNVLAFAGYILYPAAPPWYVTLNGFENLGWDVTGSAAGLLRVDALLGFPYFEETYARAAWVYGAIPSMHAGFPIFTSLFARLCLNKGRWIFYSFAILINFAAVYLEHHYVIDLIIGWILAYASFKIIMFSLKPAEHTKLLTEPLINEGLTAD